MGKLVNALFSLSLLMCSGISLAQEPGSDAPSRFGPHEGKGPQHNMHPFGGKGLQEGGPMGRLREIVDKLGLSEEQRAQLRSIKQSSRAREMREKLFQEKDNLKALFRDRGSEEKAIDAQLDKVLAIVGELGRERVSNLLEMRKILSEHQYKTLFAELEKNRPPGPKGFGPRHQGPGADKGGPMGMHDGLGPHGSPSQGGRPQAGHGPREQGGEDEIIELPF